jgi:hypothetical protein
LETISLFVVSLFFLSPSRYLSPSLSLFLWIDIAGGPRLLAARKQKKTAFISGDTKATDGRAEAAGSRRLLVRNGGSVVVVVGG